MTKGGGKRIEDKAACSPLFEGLMRVFEGLRKKIGKEDLPQHVFFFNPLYCWLQGKGISFPESGGDALN